MPGELSRAERQRQTRERLLRAARQVFAERGYAGATVPEIARVAGYSTGAVYSNFESKEELFLTLMDEAMITLAQRRADATRGVTGTGERLRRVSAQWSEYVRAEPNAFVLFIEFWSYAVRRPEVRARFAARLADGRAQLASVITGVQQGQGDAAGDAGGDAAGSIARDIAKDIASVVQALGLGFALQHLLDPEESGDWSWRGVLERIAGEGSAPSMGTP